MSVFWLLFIAIVVVLGGFTLIILAVRSKKFLKFFAPFALVAVIIVFMLNIYFHGSIPHPGKATYKGKCAQCHGDDGEGIKTLVPPLKNSDFALQHFDSIPCWLKKGMNYPINVNGILYDQPMYPNDLDEIQTANVLNFISQEIIHSDSIVNSAWVTEKWKNCK